MKMIEIINKISVVYREECDKANELRKELWDIEKSLIEVEKTYGENITLAEYHRLTSRKEVLIKEIELKKQYCEGISCVREMLMDLGFDTEINDNLNGENNMKYNDIPQEALNEIAFMIGSTEECNSEYLKPIIERHGYVGFDFLLINPEDDKELTLDIYKELFLTNICAPFLED